MNFGKCCKNYLNHPNTQFFKTWHGNKWHHQWARLCRSENWESKFVVLLEMIGWEVFWSGPLLGRPEIMGHKLQHFMPVSLCVRLSCYWLSFNNAFTEKLVLNADLWVCIFWQRLNESNTSRLEMTFKFYSLLYVARPMRTHVLFFSPACLLAPRVVYCYNKGFGNLRSN